MSRWVILHDAVEHCLLLRGSWKKQIGAELPLEAPLGEFFWEESLVGF